MILKQQVVSLDIARKLKDLKVKQKSYFYHLMQNGGSGRLVKSIQVGQELRQGTGGVFVSAFTVAELGEILKGATNTWYDDSKWICAFVSHEEKKNIRLEYGKTEADARANMLVFLLENKLITL